MLVIAGQIVYQKEHPDENLKKINKCHQKYPSLRKINFVKKILNSFTQNSLVKVKTYFTQIASLFSLVKLLF